MCSFSSFKFKLADTINDFFACLNNCKLRLIYNLAEFFYVLMEYWDVIARMVAAELARLRIMVYSFFFQKSS
jgi:hypothetical protein